MKHFYLKLLTGTLFFLLSNSSFGEIPEGGTPLNATSGTTYQKLGAGTLTVVSVADQPFTTALRLATGANMNNAWDSQIKFPSVAGIEANDVVLVAFYARTISAQVETGEGGLIVTIENNTTYAKELYQKVNIGNEWKQYFAPVVCVSNLAASQVSYAFHTGFSNQTIELADIRFINYKQTRTLEEMPVTEITYVGQAPDAEWRAPAQERINLHRKGTAQIEVYDSNGQVLEGVPVSVEMTRHAFGWGTAIPANRFMSDATFRNKVYELFNEVVFENDLKWPGFNPANLNIKRTIDSLDKYNIPLRGHTIIWPAWRWLPTWLKQYENDKVALRRELDKRIDDVTQFTKGRVVDWDVLNEPYSEKDLMRILGNEVMADWFKRARINDREVKLYINDYGILSGGGINQVKQDYYFKLVQDIESWGGKIDGIGLQGHFGGDLTAISKIYSLLDRYAQLGKEIKITEHDINTNQRAVQADFTRDFMTICFSHPAVKSFLFWGFWENSHWMPNAALYNADWSIRPHGEAYKDLVFNQWWTPHTELLTDAQGKTSFEGFLGTYKYTYTIDDIVFSGTFTLDNSNGSGIENKIILSADGSFPEQVYITSSIPAVLCQGETITLDAPQGDGLTYRWFANDELIVGNTDASLTTGNAGMYKVEVTKGDIVVTSSPFEVKVNPIPDSAINIAGDLSFCPGGHASLSVANPSNEYTYTWMKGTTRIEGSVTSVDVKETGSYTLVTHAHGCSATSEPVEIVVLDASSAECSSGIFDDMEGLKVYPNPFKGSFTLETGGVNFNNLTVELYNTVGELLFKSEIHPTENKIVIPVTAPGFYNLKVSNDESVKTFKMIGIH